MTFTDDVARLSEQVRKRSDSVIGEEATKQALILPFFNALGYDVWDPTEVKPEYISDAATKKSGQFEKVDYAVSIDGTIVILVEAKARNQKAEAHDGQLNRYYTWTESAKVGIVTNGVDYRFFTDLRRNNIMDDEPFFSFNVLQYEPKDIENLKFFHRDNFDVAAISRHAEEMVYVKGMTQLVGDLLRTPSEEFIRFLVSEVGKVSSSCMIEGRITSRVVERFQPIVKKSIQNSLVDLMTRSLSQEISISEEIKSVEVEEIESAEVEQDADSSRVETTDEELAAFEKIKTIASTSTVSQMPVSYKDVVSYFGVHIGTPHRWFLRLYLSPKRKNFVTRLPVVEVEPLAKGFEIQEVSASMGGAASRILFSSIDDLDNLAPLILRCYEAESARY
jgi:predicted type IV restriction endonuclease